MATCDEPDCPGEALLSLGPKWVCLPCYTRAVALEDLEAEAGRPLTRRELTERLPAQLDVVLDRPPQGAPRPQARA